MENLQKLILELLHELTEDELNEVHKILTSSSLKQTEYTE